MADEKIELETSTIGSETASKTVGEKSLEGSNPSVSAEPTPPKKPAPKPPEPKPEPEKLVVPTLYKLNFRRANGDIRSDIPKAVIHDLVSKWSDLLRIIPANRWTELKEIVEIVWEWEKRQYRPMYAPRTRQQIERGVVELVEAGVVLEKT